MALFDSIQQDISKGSVYNLPKSYKMATTKTTTNTPMLLPSVQYSNLLKGGIESGSITGDNWLNGLGLGQGKENGLYMKGGSVFKNDHAWYDITGNDTKITSPATVAQLMKTDTNSTKPTPDTKTDSYDWGGTAIKGVEAFTAWKGLGEQKRINNAIIDDNNRKYQLMLSQYNDLKKTRATNAARSEGIVAHPTAQGTA